MMTNFLTFHNKIIKYGCKDELYLGLIDDQVERINDLADKYRFERVKHNKETHEIIINHNPPEPTKGTYLLVAYAAKRKMFESILMILIDLCQNSLDYDARNEI